MHADTVAGGEPQDAADWGLFADLAALIDRGDPRFTFFSSLDGAEQALGRIEAGVRSSMWNMQRHETIAGVQINRELNERSAHKGIEMRYILPPYVAERRCPLISSCCPYLRLTPVGHPMLITDRRLLLVGNATGDTLWTTVDPELVARGVRHYERVWGSARPAVPPGEDTPFTPRMVEVGIRLVNGATDREIARALGVSERTVSADVREMSRRLGARSRTHAIALISGVAP